MKTILMNVLWILPLCIMMISCNSNSEETTLHITEADGQPMAHALLLTGGGWHDYDYQKTVLVEALETKLNITVDVDHSAGDSSEGDIMFHRDFSWAEQYDLVIYNMCFDQHHRTEESRSVVQAHVDNQLPAVAIHCAIHSYNLQEDDTWHRFVGVRSVEHQDHMPFTVDVLESSHPVMTGFPDEWTTPEGELYNIINLYDETVPLAHAYGKETEAYQVTAWTNTYEGVPVFGTTIGHHNVTFEHPNFLNLIAGGVLWALDGFDEDGHPSDEWVRDYP